MTSLLAALFLLQTPGAPASIPADSYADSATANLVARARLARERNERLVTSYTASVSQRMGAGIRALSRDRMLYHQELSAKISWKRDGKSTITVTGARQGVPVAKQTEEVPRYLDASVRWLVVNPAQDYLGMIGDDGDGFVYPLREGGEKDYRFASGDTTIITLASGKKIRLLQLTVTPRRSEWQLISGALWFDADSYGLVRAVFRPARPYELRRDSDPEDMEDVPSWVNATGEIKFITMEYGLYEDRWWMLRYAALDAIGNVGSWLGVPFKFERIYSDYEVDGGTPPPVGSTFTPAGTRRVRANYTTAVDTAVVRSRRDSVRAVRRECLDRAEGPEAARACRRPAPRQDSALAVVVPPDTLSLLNSPELGPPILQMGDLITESELRGMADAFGVLPKAPLISRVEVPRGMRAIIQNARFNRVEALSLGLRGSYQTGRVTFDGLFRIGLADVVPNGEAGVALIGQRSRIRLGGYQRLAAFNPENKPFGVVNSVRGFVAQRDDGEYFRTTGAELSGQNSETGWWSWRVFGERQSAAEVETSISLPHLFDSEQEFRANTAADPADAFGASVTLRSSQPLSRTVQLGGESTIEAVGGDYRYARGSATIRATFTPKAVLAFAIEASAGTTSGVVPAQGRFYLGGHATLRGYDGAVTVGDSYWRGRLEAGNTFPAVRIIGFTDVGWAGARSDFWGGKPLLGSGVGASFFDGLIRLDLSRGMRAPTGWRFDLYFDGRL